MTWKYPFLDVGPCSLAVLLFWLHDILSNVLSHFFPTSHTHTLRAPQEYVDLPEPATEELMESVKAWEQEQEITLVDAEAARVR